MRCALGLWQSGPNAVGQDKNREQPVRVARVKIGEPDPQVLATLIKTEGSAGLNEKIKRRTHVVRIFPNAESCLRLVRALAVETREKGARPRVRAWGFDRCLWRTDWTRAFAVVNYEQAVEPFLKTDL